MRAVATNILARIILRDDARPTAISADVRRQPVGVPLSVWTELGRLLFKRFECQREVVAGMLSTLPTMAMETACIAAPAGTSWAIERFRAGANCADMVHLIAARGAADTFATFDARTACVAADPPVPIDTFA